MQKGPVQGDAAHGMDKPYAADKAWAAQDLKSSMAGAEKRPPVPRDDKGLKNPDGDLDKPAANSKPR